MKHKDCNVVIIDHNGETREQLFQLINSISNFRVVGEYDQPQDAIKYFKHDLPGLIIIDLDKNATENIKIIQNLRRLTESTPIIVNSDTERHEDIILAFRAGADGWVRKSSSNRELTKALKEAVMGGAPISPDIARFIIRSFRKNPHSPLTTRESQVLELLTMGKTYSTIANELFITKETARSHIKNIYSKLGVNSKSDAIAKATKQKFI